MRKGGPPLLAEKKKKIIVHDVSSKAADSVAEKSKNKVQSLLDDQPSHTDEMPPTPMPTIIQDEQAINPEPEPIEAPDPEEFQETHQELPKPQPRPEKVSAVRTSVLPGFGSPGFKLFQLIAGGVLLAFGLFFEFSDTDAEGANFMSIAFLVVAFLILAYEVIMDGISKLFHLKLLDSDVLMTIACIGGVFVGQFPAATAAMFLYVLAGFISSLNASHSDALFGALEDFEVDSVYVYRDGGFQSVAPERVWPGETILVRQNELVPIDGVVAGGSGLLDTVLLTGDEAPKYVFAGDKVYSGMVVTSDELQIVTTCPYAGSTAEKVADFMYDDSAEESRESEFDRKFSLAFGIVVIVLGLALGIVPSILTDNWHEWMRIAFTFMILAGSAELLLHGPLCFENGLGTAFYNGVLVRGDGPLEKLSRAKKVVFNKTGTLTKGEPDIVDMIPAEGYRSAQLLEMAAKAEYLSDHRIAACIRKAYGKKVDQATLVNFKEVPGFGVSVYVDGHRLVAGNVRCMLAEGIDVRESHQAGNKLHVAVDQKYLGCIVTSDTSRRDSREAIDGLHDLGLEGVTMLTGGARGPSKLLAEELGIDEFGSELAPEDKIAALQTFSQRLGDEGTLVFVGDGIKDRQLLAFAEPGVALGGFRTTDVYDTTDVIIMPESPSRVVNLLDTARRTFTLARANTVVTIALKAIVMVLAVVGIASLWTAAAVTLVSAILTGIGCRAIRAGWEKTDHDSEKEVHRAEKSAEKAAKESEKAERKAEKAEKRADKAARKAARRPKGDDYDDWDDPDDDDSYTDID